MNQSSKIRYDSLRYFCLICHEPHNLEESIIPSCCNDAINFHHKCMKEWIYHSGIATKCPCCGNHSEAYNEYLKNEFDFCIPDRIPTWEFTGQYDGHKTDYVCSATVCCSLNGRTFKNETGDWSIKLCAFCGSIGAHSKCCDTDIFTCKDCHVKDKESLLDNIKNIDLVARMDRFKGMKYGRYTRFLNDSDDDE